MTETTSRSMDRRRFLGGTAGVAGGALLSGPLAGLTAHAAHAADGRPPRTAGRGQGGYGPLQPVADSEGSGRTLALPAGFAFALFGEEGTLMSDGNLTPKAHDGMGSFARPDVDGQTRTRLIRNHEDRDSAATATVKGNPATAYDSRAGGSTTTLDVLTDPETGAFTGLAKDFISINGTLVNCAGGPTPSGSWLTCEETTSGPTQGYAKPHGYVFEVPSSANDEVTAVPLTAMGRFVHEAVAIDPRTGIVYETEDRSFDETRGFVGSGFYRFLPADPGNLTAGGKLQALKIKGEDNTRTFEGQTVGRSRPVEWVTIDDPDPASAEIDTSAVFRQALAKGAAIFQRLEGCWEGNGSIFFNSTSGGEAGEGQVFEYRPTGRSAGQLRLVFESPAEEVLDNPDNINVSPRGGVLLCEDGDGTQFLRGLTRDGKIFDFCENLINDREWCGACWSEDANTLFVNIQGDTSGPGRPQVEPGMTFAIWGPWEDGAL